MVDPDPVLSLSLQGVRAMGMVGNGVGDPARGVRAEHWPVERIL